MIYPFWVGGKTGGEGRKARFQGGSERREKEGTYGPLALLWEMRISHEKVCGFSSFLRLTKKTKNEMCFGLMILWILNRGRRRMQKETRGTNTGQRTRKLVLCFYERCINGEGRRSR